MKWNLKIRNQSHALTSIEEVRAVNPTEEFSDAAEPSEYAEAFGEVLSEPDPAAGPTTGVPTKDQQAFENAGWKFVSPNEKVKRAAALREEVPHATAASEVFVTDSGETLIPTDRATVQLLPDLTDEEVHQVLKEYKLEVIDKLGFAKHMYEVRVAAGRPLPEVIEELQENNVFIFAEPNFLQALKVRGGVPSDTHFFKQWQHLNDGSLGKAGEDIKSILAWQVSKGQGTRIAVIDAGMQIDHPDLADGIVGGGFFRINSGAVQFVRLTPGMTNFPDITHGTFCLGMAGARAKPIGDLTKGGLGSAPEADLIAIACSDNLVVDQGALARSVHFAVEPSFYDPAAGPNDGADIISCSIDTNNPLLSVLKIAIESAAQNGRKRNGVSLGVPIFWAVANATESMVYDPVCRLPEVIAVGRYDSDGRPRASAFGDELAFIAPGWRVYSTRSNSLYGIDDGTSFATALAAGVGALVLSLHPDWTAAEVRQKLEQSCDPVNGNVGHDPDSGFGKLNAFRAVS